MVASIKRLGVQFMDVRVPLSHVVALTLALMLGVAQVLNQAVLVIPSRWHAYLGVALAAGAYLGVKPLVGPQFRQALHLPAAVSQIVTLLLAVGTVVVGAGILAAGSIVLVILSTGTTVLLALGFGPATAPAAAAAAARRSKRVAV